MKKILILICVLLSGWASASENPEANPISTENTIKVSRPLYNAITDFLLAQSLNEELQLQGYLYANYGNSKEVDAFLNQYFSGVSTPKSTGKSTASGATCTCKSIMPTKYELAKSLDIQEPPLGSTPGYVEVQNGSKKKWARTRQHTSGPAKDLYLNVFGKNGAWDRTLSSPNKHIAYEILNLCTNYGVIDSDCLCDKVINVNGEYHYSYNVKGSSTSSVLVNHGRWANIQDIFAYQTFERFANTGSWHVSTVDIPKLQSVKVMYETHVGFNQAALVDMLAAMAKIAVKVASGGKTGLGNPTSTTGKAGTINGIKVSDMSDITEVIKALKNFNVTHTANNPGPVNNASVPFVDTRSLRANIPRVIYFVSDAVLKAGGHGPAFSAAATYKSTMFMDFNIPLNTNGYDPAGKVINNNACCNESYGGWYITNNYAQGPLTDLAIKTKVKKDLNAHTLNPWEYSTISLGQSDAHVMLPDILQIVSNEGSVFSGRNCGCQNLLDILTNNRRLIAPRLVAEQDRFCPGNTFVIKDLNFPASLVASGQVTTVWKLNGVLLGAPNTDVVTVSAPGMYSIEYSDAASPLCVSIGHYDIKNCDGVSVAGPGTGNGGNGGSGDDGEGKWAPSPTSINEAFSANAPELTLFPNPTNGLLQLSMGQSLAIMKTVVVYNLVGQQVYLEQLNKDTHRHQLDLSSLEHGTYLVKVETDQGSFNQRIVKQ